MSKTEEIIVKEIPAPAAQTQPKKNVFERAIDLFVSARDWPFVYFQKNPRFGKIFISAIIFILYNVYFVGTMVHQANQNVEFRYWEFCDGHGLLIIITAMVYFGLFYYNIFIPLFGEKVYNNVFKPIGNAFKRLEEKSPMFITILNGSAALLVLAAITVFLIVDTKDERERLYSFVGIFAFVFIGFAISAHPAKIRWRHVIWGLGIEFVFGLLVLRWEVGRNIFQCLGNKVTRFLGFTDNGSGFLFAYLGSVCNSASEKNSQYCYKMYDTSRLNLTALENQGVTDFTEEKVQNMVMVLDSIYYGTPFMFGILSVIYFFSFCTSMLYYLGALQWVVLKLGWLLSVTIGTTAAESLNAAGNIFLGQTEAPLLIRTFLPDMTKSEIHAVMTGGFATIAGTVLAAYIGFGIPADQIISGSVMAAPTALAVSKLIYPETEESKTTFKNIKMEKDENISNVLDAASQGASAAIMLVLNIAASLIAFLAFVAFLDATVAWFGTLAGAEELTFQTILGWIFTPVAFLMGVHDSDDMQKVAELIAVKIMITEFPAFATLGGYIDNCEISPRAGVIATYALLGFANVASIGIQLGGIGAMAPNRKADLAQVVTRAFIAGCLTSFINACVAGALIGDIETNC